MSEKIAVVGLDGIVWTGQGLLSGIYSEMVKESMIDAPFKRVSDSSSRNMVKSIGRGIKGKSIHRMAPLADKVAAHSITRVDRSVVRTLKQFVEGGHELFAMSSAPRFVVETALDQLEDQNELSFNRDHILATLCPVEDGHYTGQASRLPKQEAVRNLLNKLDLVSVDIGVINGVNDLGWANTYCTDIIPINPGPGLYARLNAAEAN